jgi:hypothetical protein
VLCQLADLEPSVPKVDKGVPKYSAYQLSDLEWEHIVLLIEILKVRWLLLFRDTNI